jgi:hypothetical protein
LSLAAGLPAIASAVQCFAGRLYAQYLRQTRDDCVETVETYPVVGVNYRAILRRRMRVRIGNHASL